MTSGNSEKRPGSSAPSGEAACWLEGDDEIFTAAESARDDHAEIIVPAGCAGAGATQMASEGQDTGVGVSDRERLAELIESGDQRALIRRAIADPGSVVAARWPEESGPAWSARAVEQTLLAAGWRPPLLDSETQWGCRDRRGQVHSVGVENETQARAMLSMTPVCREVGPWIEVPRG